MGQEKPNVIQSHIFNMNVVITTDRTYLSYLKQLKRRLRFGIPVHPSLTMRFIPLSYKVTLWCATARGFRTYSEKTYLWAYLVHVPLENRTNNIELVFINQKQKCTAHSCNFNEDSANYYLSQANVGSGQRFTCIHALGIFCKFDISTFSRCFQKHFIFEWKHTISYP